MPAKPTTSLPGTEAKLLVMVDRLRLGQSLHHPLDAGAKPADIETAVLDMTLQRDALGVHWNDRKPAAWRARPWWTIKPGVYRRFHLGYFRDREKAIVAIRQWRELAEEVGPEKATRSIIASRRRS